jgi:hypothetical protein
VTSERQEFLSLYSKSLISGHKLLTDTITFSFLTDADGRTDFGAGPVEETYEFMPFTDFQKDVVRYSFDYLSSFLPIEFVEVDGNAGYLGFGRYDIMHDGGYASYPTNPVSSAKGSVWIDAENSDNPFRGKIGELGQKIIQTLTHEIGHALGLSHPMAYGGESHNSELPDGLDSGILTTMSYRTWYYGPTGSGGQPWSLRPLDIAALGAIYGFKTSSEDSVYQLNRNTAVAPTHIGNEWSISVAFPYTLVDTGGFDTVDLLQMEQFDDPLHFDFDYGLLAFPNAEGRIAGPTQWEELLSPQNNPALQIQPGTVIERLIGGDGVDIVKGNGRDQVIQTNDGNDIIEGGGGDDTIDGGKGVDQLNLSSARTAYTVSIAKGEAIIVDRTTATGTDTVTAVEQLKFNGVDTLLLSQLDGVALTGASELNALVQMYIAYFNRAPDAVGLFYWGTRLSQGMTMQDIAKSFFVQPETVALYPDPGDTAGFVSAVYNNFLGRKPDKDGFDYWVGELQSGSVGRDVFMLALINGAKAATGSVADVSYIEGKGNIGAYFSVIKGISDVDSAMAIMNLYDGSEGSLVAAKQAIDDAYALSSRAVGGDFLVSLVGVMEDPFG